MFWLLAIAIAVVGFAGGFMTCMLFFFGTIDDTDNCVDYYKENEWK